MASFSSRSHDRTRRRSHPARFDPGGCPPDRAFLPDRVTGVGQRSPDRPVATCGRRLTPSQSGPEGLRGRLAAARQALPFRLARSWIAIVAELPPFVRAVLLVIWLATMAMYALGLASVAVRARMATAPVEEPRAQVIEQIVVHTDPPIADPASAPSETPTAPAAAAVAAPSLAATPPPSAPAARGSLPSMPTLATTPNQHKPQAPPPISTPTPPPTPAPRPTPAAPPASAAAPRPPASPAAPAAGTLPPRGSFAKSEFAYPGDRSVYTVNLQIEPDDAGLLKNA